MFHGNPVITVVGNLVSDPEVKFTQGGHALANFSVVTSDSKRGADGSYEDVNTSFWNCVAWRRTAENLAESDLHKGDKVILIGTIHQESWETKEGEKRSGYKVTADHIGPALDFRTVSVNRPTRSTEAKAGAWAATDGDAGAPF
jgi:single-strand DNA-binding protein